MFYICTEYCKGCARWGAELAHLGWGGVSRGVRSATLAAAAGTKGCIVVPHACAFSIKLMSTQSTKCTPLRKHCRKEQEVTLLHD